MGSWRQHATGQRRRVPAEAITAAEAEAALDPDTSAALSAALDLLTRR
jgi:hypothetical protein